MWERVTIGAWASSGETFQHSLFFIMSKESEEVYPFHSYEDTVFISAFITTVAMMALAFTRFTPQILWLMRHSVSNLRWTCATRTGPRGTLHFYDISYFYFFLYFYLYNAFFEPTCFFRKTGFMVDQAINMIQSNANVRLDRLLRFAITCELWGCNYKTKNAFNALQLPEDHQYKIGASTSQVFE